MKQGRVTKVIVMITIATGMLSFLLMLPIVKFWLSVSSNVRPFSNEMAGEYYVERINAATNTYESENYYYVTKEGANKLYAYMPNTQKWEDILGLENVETFAVAEDKLYVSIRKDAESEYWVLDIKTGEKQLLSECEIPEAQALSLEPQRAKYKKIELELSQEGYKFANVFSEYLDDSEHTIIGLAQNPVRPDGDEKRIEQENLKYDILFSYDPSLEICKILYETKTNRTRIIGYQDGYVYLYKQNQIVKEHLEDGASEVLTTIPKGEHYTFDWWKEYLVVIDHETDELVTMVECF